MIKNITFRLVRYKIRSTLPKINKYLYKRIFGSTYKYLVYLKPSQIWIIILALLNKTNLKGLLGIPSLFILFSNLLSEGNSNEAKLDSKVSSNLLFSRLELNKFTDDDNKWENFFWILILLALIRRFTTSLFKFLLIPFKVAFIYFLLKHLGFDLNYIYNVLNNISLGIIDWFHDKIINFFEYFNKNDKNN